MPFLKAALALLLALVMGSAAQTSLAQVGTATLQPTRTTTVTATSSVTPTQTPVRTPASTPVVTATLTSTPPGSATRATRYPTVTPTPTATATATTTSTARDIPGSYGTPLPARTAQATPSAPQAPALEQGEPFLSPLAGVTPVALVAAAPSAVLTPDKVIYLTFDDGPNSNYTQAILDVLAEHDARATFFVLGAQAQALPDLVTSIYDAGHGVANHTWAHASLEWASWATFESQVQAVADVLGEQESACLRPPYGARNQTTYDFAERMGYDIALWSIDPQDWRLPGAQQIADAIVERAYDQAVVLLHDGGGDRTQTIEALRLALPRLQAEGYAFKAVCRDVPFPPIGDALLGIPSEITVAPPVELEPDIVYDDATVQAAGGTIPAARSFSPPELSLATSHTAGITFPQAGATVRGRVLIQGYVLDPLERWTLEVLIHGEVPLELAAGDSGRAGIGALGIWDTRALPDGAHMLRLRVTRAGGSEELLADLIVRN